MPLDIDKSYYNTGTATVAANGTAVTGQGTAWLQAVRAGDLFGTHKGDGIRILSVNSNTSLTLAYPWTGPAQTAAAYEIQFTPYDVGYQAAVRQLLLAMASGNVEALGALSGTADTLPYFTGAGQMAEAAFPAAARALLNLSGSAAADKFPYLTSANTAALGVLTPFARTLLDDADAATAVATLSRGFGWGANNANVNVPGNNLDTLRTNGVFRATGETISVPTNVGVWQVIHAGQGANYAVQLAFQITASLALPGVMTRVLNNNVWSSWRPITGEHGSNANGNYVRFADGTQICTGSVTVTRANNSQAAVTWSYPAAFLTIPFVDSVLPSGSGNYSGDISALNSMRTYSGANTDSAIIGVNKSYSASNWTSGSISGVLTLAIGRWF